MAVNLAKIVHGVSAVQTWLRQLRQWGLERERLYRLIDRAEAEGREPTPAEVRAELGDLAETLEHLERQIDAAEGGEPPSP